MLCYAKLSEYYAMLCYAILRYTIIYLSRALDSDRRHAAHQTKPRKARKTA